VEANLQQTADDEHDTDAAIRRWLLEVIAQTGLKATPLAKAAGLAPSTLLRALDPKHPGSLETRSIEKIVNTFHVSPPEMFSSRTRDDKLISVVGMTGHATSRRREKEVLEMGKDAVPELGATKDQFVYTLNTDAISTFGYLPGDIILVDTKVKGRTGDAVLGQMASPYGGVSELVLRLYDPPYLISGARAVSLYHKPLLIDNERVLVLGVVIKTMRLRKSD
jgi:hypothetical protein